MGIQDDVCIQEKEIKQKVTYIIKTKVSKGEKECFNKFKNSYLIPLIQVLPYLDQQIMMKNQFLIDQDSDQSQVWDLPKHNIRRNTHTKIVNSQQLACQPSQENQEQPLLSDKSISHLQRLFRSGAVKNVEREASIQNRASNGKQDPEFGGQIVSIEGQDDKILGGRKQYLQQQIKININENEEKRGEQSLKQSQFCQQLFLFNQMDLLDQKKNQKDKAQIEAFQSESCQAAQRKFHKAEDNILKRLYEPISEQNCISSLGVLNNRKGQNEQAKEKAESLSKTKEEYQELEIRQADNADCFPDQTLLNANQKNQTLPQTGIKLGKNKGTKINTYSSFIDIEGKKQTKGMKATWWMADRTVIKIKGDKEESLQGEGLELKEKQGKKEIKKRKREKKMENEDVIGQKFAVFLESLKNRVEKNERTLQARNKIDNHA